MEAHLFRVAVLDVSAALRIVHEPCAEPLPKLHNLGGDLPICAVDNLVVSNVGVGEDLWHLQVSCRSQVSFCSSTLHSTLVLGMYTYSHRDPGIRVPAAYKGCLA